MLAQMRGYGEQVRRRVTKVGGLFGWDSSWEFPSVPLGETYTSAEHSSETSCSDFAVIGYFGPCSFTRGGSTRRGVRRPRASAPRFPWNSHAAPEPRPWSPASLSSLLSLHCTLCSRHCNHLWDMPPPRMFFSATGVDALLSAWKALIPPPDLD